MLAGGGGHPGFLATPSNMAASLVKVASPQIPVRLDSQPSTVCSWECHLLTFQKRVSESSYKQGEASPRGRGVDLGVGPSLTAAQIPWGPWK